MQKRVILTADDYGCSDFIDAGVHEAVEYGKINSVAAFVSHDDSRNRIRELLKLKQWASTSKNLNVGIGLHFSITSGKALTGSSSLTFPSEDEIRSKFFKEAHGYDFLLTEPDDVRKELRAQLDEMRDILKDEPIDHLSHHHGFIYLSAGLFEAYVDELKLYNRKHGLQIALRSPISWFRKFNDDPTKKNADSECTKLFKNLDKQLITPAGLEGIKLMMWKKYFQTTYGVMKKRMEVLNTEHQQRCPNLLCDILYGQVDVERLDQIFGIFQNNALLQCAGYNSFSAELMFHLGKGDPHRADIPHGVNPNYFSHRITELETLLNYDLDSKLNQTQTQKSIFAELFTQP
jgi:predicted glycoside hydrolase/deacetylase ChbG (UPF0249 family)